MTVTMRHPLLITTAALAILGFSHAHAGKAVMTDLCHFDAESGTYKKISVPMGTPFEKHMENHGDMMPGQMFEGVGLDENCGLQVAKVFARAYIDVDPGDGGYNSDDIDIAVVMDGDNGNGVLDAGDLLYLNQYPKSLTPLAGGENDGVNEFIVEGPLVLTGYVQNGNFLTVNVTPQYNFFFAKDSPRLEAFIIQDFNSQNALLLLDGQEGGSSDRISTLPDGDRVPWVDPGVIIDIFGEVEIGDGDDGFVDIEIYP